jgi:pilus assembly protein CpaB
MGNKKILIIAIILAVVFVGLLQLYLSGLKKEYGADVSFESIVVASVDIAAHTPINNKMITLRKFPQQYVHKEAIREKDQNFIVGQPTTFAVAKGQPLLWTDFSGSKERIGLAGVIDSDDERALTIPVTEISGVGYLLKPDDHVDIMGTFVNPKGQLTTLTLLQNVTVLAVGTNMGETEEREEATGKKGAKTRRIVQNRYSSATVLVTPEEAELLVFSQGKGSLMLVLRKEGAHQIVDNLPEMNFDRIFVPEVRQTLQQKRNQRIKIIQDSKTKKK